jgi:hypothetical protein
LEWLGSLYTEHSTGKFEVDQNGTLVVSGYGRVVWPGENIEAMLISAAKKKRLGQQFRAGVMVDGDFPLIHDGPKTVEALCGNLAFMDVRGVDVGGKRVQRTRPIFRNWSLKFRVSYLPDLVNEKDLVQSVNEAGRTIGLSDYRPKYGRFVVVS